MDNKMRIFGIALLILLAAASRWIPHPPNFTPLLAIALFGGTQFRSKFLSVLVPLSILALSDLALGAYPYMWAVYMSFVVVIALGWWLKSEEFSWSRWTGGVFGASVVFFLTSNFAVWALGTMYPKTLSGLWSCYVAALPFFHNTLISTVVYGGVLFGAWALMKRWQPEFFENSRMMFS